MPCQILYFKPFSPNHTKFSKAVMWSTRFISCLITQIYDILLFIYAFQLLTQLLQAQLEYAVLSAVWQQTLVRSVAPTPQPTHLSVFLTYCRASCRTRTWQCAILDPVFKLASGNCFCSCYIVFDVLIEIMYLP